MLIDSHVADSGRFGIDAVTDDGSIELGLKKRQPNFDLT